jgi:hypothetical protein
VVIREPEADLLEIIGALAAASRLPGRLHGGQQQPDQHSNDGNNHQELDQGKGFSHG